MTIDADTFRALARSSPLLWRTVRLRWRETGAGTTRDSWERAWIRRPGDLRVETLDGALVAAVRGCGPDLQIGEWVVEDDGLGHVSYRRGAGSGAATMMTRGRVAEEEVRAYVDRRRRESSPVLRPDRLAGALPGRSWHGETVPFHTNYTWVAMLEPAELADGADPDDDAGHRPPGVDVHEVVEIDHHGRPALEARVTPLPTYNPRCGCCPLLDGAEAHRIESGEYGGDLPVYGDGSSSPDATVFRVRLDRETGICVEAEALDGAYAARGHVTVVEEVDAPYPDDLFASGL